MKFNQKRASLTILSASVAELVTELVEVVEARRLSWFLSWLLSWLLSLSKQSKSSKPGG
jgi:hypothetical protein